MQYILISPTNQLDRRKREEIKWYVPESGRDPRDRYPRSIHGFRYIPITGDLDSKVVEYYKTFGFVSEAQLDPRPDPRLCNQHNCVATVDTGMPKCGSCLELTCYTCGRDFDYCRRHRHKVCKRCQSNCYLCKTEFILSDIY